MMHLASLMLTQHNWRIDEEGKPGSDKLIITNLARLSLNEAIKAKHLAKFTLIQINIARFELSFSN